MGKVSEPTRRTVLAAAATAAAFGLAASALPGAAAPARSGATEGDNAIRPFRIDVPEDVTDVPARVHRAGHLDPISRAGPSGQS